jgi:poly(3-hydroxybutyrate) depolymerase
MPCGRWVLHLKLEPKVFAGGAIIAGLPYRSADNMMEAFFRMKGYGGPSDRRLDSLLRGASEFEGPWPTISVWHGGSDETVDSSNADSIVGQWQKIHKVEGPPTREETVDPALFIEIGRNWLRAPESAVDSSC